MAIDLLKYMIWKNGTGGGGASHEKTVGPAPILSISDAKAKPAKSLIVGMEPIQDLHGYDGPWPAGGGKNKLDDSSYTQLIATSFANHTFTGTKTIGNTNSAFVRTYKNGSTVNTYDVTKSNLVAGQRVNFTIVFDSSFDSFDVGFKLSSVNNCAAQFANNFSDGTYTISFLVDVIPEVGTAGKFSYVQLESGLTASDFVPYSNECPISGRTGVTVERTGKNLLDASSVTHNAYNIGNIPNTLLPSTEYTFSINGVTGNRYKLYLAKSGAPLTAVVALNSDYIPSPSGSFSTFTTPEDMSEYQLLCLAGNINGAGNEPISDILPQCEIGASSTISPYEPYVGASYPVVFPDSVGTVYGGTVDVVSGVLTVTHGLHSFTGNEYWSFALASGHYRAYTNVVPIANYSGSPSTITDKILCCNLFPIVSWETIYNGELGCGQTGQYVGFGMDAIGISVESDWRDYLRNNTISLVYELATPQTYQLTPQQIQLLKGSNTLWSDADDLTLTYLAKKETQSLGNSAPLLFGGLNLGNALNDTNQETPQETVMDSADGDPNEEE